MQLRCQEPPSRADLDDDDSTDMRATVIVTSGDAKKSYTTDLTIVFLSLNEEGT